MAIVIANYNSDIRSFARSVHKSHVKFDRTDCVTAVKRILCIPLNSKQLIELHRHMKCEQLEYTYISFVCLALKYIIVS